MLDVLALSRREWEGSFRMRDSPRRWGDFPRRPTAATGERSQPDEYPEPWVPIHDGNHHQDGWDGDDDTDSGEN